jgi:hypothetical protein
MATPLTDAGFSAALADFAHTAFRLELQRTYLVPDEDGALERFLAGDPPTLAELGGLRTWFEQVAQQIGEGKRMERVRVHDEPPTDYQRFERSMDRWNLDVGETLHYLTRQRAHEIGLLPAAGPDDWWLLDSTHLIIMRFDPDGRWIGNELETDPAAVVRACAWRDLAIHYCSPAQGAAAQ